MFSKFLPCILSLGLIFILGCSKKDSGPKTLVIDLDRIAAATGWDQQIKADMEKKGQDLNQKVNDAKNNLESQIKALRDQFGKTPTADQKTQLAQYGQQANQKMQQLVASARQQNAVYRSQLVNAFQEKVRPYAEKIAKERGAGTVLFKTNSLFYVAPESDITGAVIEALQGVKLNDSDLVTPPKTTDSSKPSEPGK